MILTVPLGTAYTDHLTRPSIYKRFNRWAGDGTWQKLLTEVQKQADAAGEIDWVVSIDSTIARVHQHGATLARDTGGCAESQESVVRAA